MDIQLAEKIKGKKLVEKGTGAYWDFEFSSSGLLMEIKTKREKVYHRSQDYSMFSKRDVEYINKCLMFVRKKKNGMYDYIFLSHMYNQEKRADKAVLSGFIIDDYYDLDHEDYILPFNPRVISWILK